LAIGLQVLPTLSGIDAIVTDPPYGIGFDRYESHEDSIEEYGQFMQLLVGHAERLTTGPKAFWQGMPNCARWNQWFPPQFRLFAACKGFVQFRPTAVQWSGIQWCGGATCAENRASTERTSTYNSWHHLEQTASELTTPARGRWNKPNTLLTY